MIRTYEKICKSIQCPWQLVLRYLYEKEHEIDLLTTALEGIRYRIPPYEIRDLIFADVNIRIIAVDTVMMGWRGASGRENEAASYHRAEKMMSTV